MRQKEIVRGALRLVPPNLKRGQKAPEAPPTPLRVGPPPSVWCCTTTKEITCQHGHTIREAEGEPATLHGAGVILLSCPMECDSHGHAFGVHTFDPAPIAWFCACTREQMELAGRMWNSRVPLADILAMLTRPKAPILSRRRRPTVDA
jgi:hypothetical protein